MVCEMIYFIYMLTFWSTCIYACKNNCLHVKLSINCMLLYIYIYLIVLKMYLSSCKIICPRVTNLFTTSNYLFTFQIKLFRDLDPFVRNIHFPLLILYNQMLVIFNIFVHCTLLFFHYT